MLKLFSKAYLSNHWLEPEINSSRRLESRLREIKYFKITHLEQKKTHTHSDLPTKNQRFVLKQSIIV